MPGLDRIIADAELRPPGQAAGRELLDQRENCPSGSAIPFSQCAAYVVHRQNFSGMAKPMRLQIEPRIGDLLRCVVAAVATEHDECLGLERESRRHDPADAADHDVRITHQREQFAHRQFAEDEIVVRWRQISDQPFLVRAEVGNRDHGMGRHQFGRQRVDIFRPRVARLVAPFAANRHRPDDRNWPVGPDRRRSHVRQIEQRRIELDAQPRTSVSPATG